MSLRGVAASIVALAFVPSVATARGPLLCPFRRVTGRPCPACGLTRSWQAAAHGRARESLAHHPFGLVTLAGAAWFALDDDSEARVARTDRRLLTAALAVWVTVWVVRVSRPVR
jgi:hypothetical protein